MILPVPIGTFAACSDFQYGCVRGQGYFAADCTSKMSIVDECKEILIKPQLHAEVESLSFYLSTSNRSTPPRIIYPLLSSHVSLVRGRRIIELPQSSRCMQWSILKVEDTSSILHLDWTFPFQIPSPPVRQ